VLPTATVTAVPEAAAMDAIAATPTAASEYASREAPGVGGAGDLPPATDVTGTAAPLLEAAAASGPCEICGEVELPPPAPQEKLADSATPDGPASPANRRAAVPTASETRLETGRDAGRLPAVRWLEIGLAAIADARRSHAPPPARPIGGTTITSTASAVVADGGPTDLWPAAPSMRGMRVRAL
jgi:hypothetical protein